MNGSGLRIRGNPLNGPRGPGTILAGRARDFDGAVGCATVEELIPGRCSADTAILRNKQIVLEIIDRLEAQPLTSTAFYIRS
jgi:hypothetical protein